MTTRSNADRRAPSQPAQPAQPVLFPAANAASADAPTLPTTMLAADPSSCGAPPAHAHEVPRPSRAQRSSRLSRAGDAAHEVFSPGGIVAPPGQPMRPIPGLAAPDGDPRQWQYPVGYNIGRLPRAGEQTSFAELRSLAALYDGVQLCRQSLLESVVRHVPASLPRLLASDGRASHRRWGVAPDAA
jgi:hypothetical protein